MTKRDFNRPEIHARGLIERTPLGTIRTGRELGYGCGSKFIWSACPVCDRRRWVRLTAKGRWCRSCAARRAGRYRAFVKAGEKSRARHRYLVALGKAADAAGLTIESIHALRESGHAIVADKQAGAVLSTDR
jgi:hypothetical protein